MLAAKLGQGKEALQFAEQLNITGDEEELALARDLSLSIRAQLAFEQKRFAQALQYLEQLHLQTWYGLMATSPFYSRAYQRFLKAEILVEMGKYEPALKLYQSFSQYSVYDLIYHAPAIFKMGAIFEKLGKNELAAQHYDRFVSLWENCDPDFRGKVDEAGSRAAKLRMKIQLTGN
jgi:tetratricopeptide (TPR) repeat protein